MPMRFYAAAGLAIIATGAVAAPAAKPAGALSITNARAVPAVEVVIGAGEKTVGLPKPLAPNAKATLKLPKVTGCTVSVSATFADESVVELDDFDVCKEKTIRFTD
jgi:hypothetical protein